MKTEIQQKNPEEIYGLIGNPVNHSLSPLMHNSAFEEIGKNAVYLAFKVKEKNLENAIQGIKGLEINGMNVTIPHKEKVIKFLDEIDGTAESIGAVNTILEKNGKLRGYNTDCLGALNAIKKRMEVEGKNVVILGAGGASKAICFGLKEKANLFIVNRTFKKALKLGKEVDAEVFPFAQLERVFLENKIDLLINTTPVGMYPQTGQSLVQKRLLKDMVVMDAIYNPLKTKLLRDAQANGCTIIRGIEMFVEQGVKSFELWTGETAPRKKMKEVVEEELEELGKNEGS